MARKGELNGKSCVKDWQALHIKCIAKIQMPEDKIGVTIRYIQKFYKLPYHTIYMIIHKRYKHLDYLIVDNKTL